MSRAVAPLGLPRAARLRHANDIQTVFQHGRREETRHFVLLWILRPGPGRVGFAVSRQVRGAVRRNRARRRLREAYRRLGRRQGLDAVFVARARTLDATLDELGAEMARALASASRSAGA